LRRQVQFGRTEPVGSGRRSRLDPLALPIRFTADDPAADDRRRCIDLDREHVVIRRAGRGIRMTIKLPMATFSGVALRQHHANGCVSLWLEHRDPALTVPLPWLNAADDAVAQWQLWGRSLNLPLLVVAPDGHVCERSRWILKKFPNGPAPRRRRRNSIKSRRPSILLRRSRGMLRETAAVYYRELEIIAPE
jgi:Family of unknown function (DUF6101)